MHKTSAFSSEKFVGCLLISALAAVGSVFLNTCQAQSLPLPSHIVVVIEENQGYSSIIGNTTGAPYFNALAQDTNSAVFSQMFAIEHPSQPNYLDFFSGSNQGVVDDNLPSNYPFTTDNLARELSDVSKTFITYSQDLPATGSDLVSSGSYVRKHNPVTNWVGTGAYQVPGTTNQPFTNWPSADFTNLPTISYVVANEDSDMHNGFGNATISAADFWFHEHLNSLLPWALANNTLLIVFWEEDDGLHNNNVPAIFYGPMVKGGTYTENVNLFNMLRTLEDMYALRHAGSAASVNPITDCWKARPVITPSFSLYMDTVSGLPGSLVEVTVRAKNFKNLLAAQGSISFDTSQIHFNQISSYGINNLNGSDFGLSQAANGSITFSWTDTSQLGTTLADGSVFFTMQFTLANYACAGSTITFGNTPTPIQFIDTSLNAITSYTLNPGQVTVPADSAVKAAINGPTIICSGLSATLTAGGGTSYVWNNSLGSSSQINVSPTSTTTYSVTVSVAGNCSATASQTISVSSTPVATISGPTQVCANQSVTLVANGGNTYTWSNGLGSNSTISVSPTGLTTYIVTATVGANCSATASKTVTVNSVPVANISGTTQLCSGINDTLVASGGTGYSWSNGLGNTAAIIVTPVSQTTYTVTVTNSNNCSASTSSTVQVASSPVATITGSSNLCPGNNETLIASGGTGYKWSGGLGNNASVVISPTSLTTYTVTVTNANNCSAVASKVVLIANQPVPSVSGPSSVCSGQNFTLVASGGNSYNWSNGLGTDSTLNLSISSSNIYTVTATSSAGCTAADSKTVTVVTQLTSQFSYSICPGGSYLFNGQNRTQSGAYSEQLTSTYGCDSIVTLNLTVLSKPVATIVQNHDTLTTQSFVSYEWLQNGQLVGGGLTQSITIAQTGIYSVVVTDSAGCTDTSAALNVTSLGINDITENYSVKLYPNPASGILSVEFTDNLARELEITDLEGRIVMSGSEVSKQKSFNLDGLATGLYLVQIHQGQQVKVLKFTVVR